MGGAEQTAHKGNEGMWRHLCVRACVRVCVLVIVCVRAQGCVFSNSISKQLPVCDPSLLRKSPALPAAAAADAAAAALAGEADVGLDVCVLCVYVVVVCVGV